MEMVQVNIESALTGVRAMLAEELLSRGYAQKEISRILGITPAAVTLYTRGRRGKELTERIKNLKEASVVIRDLAEQIADRMKRSETIDEFPLILDTAYRIMRQVSEGRAGKGRVRRGDDEFMQALRNRIEQEQLAAQRNMTLAVATKDEIARMLFRQIATDSMRHADILGSIVNYVERPGARKSTKNEILQIEAMIREEESATERPIKMRDGDPAVKLLLSSIDMDEQKHSRLLNGLLKIDRSLTRKPRSA